MIKDIKIICSRVIIDPQGYRQLEVSLDEADIDNVLENLTISDILSYFNENDILDEIGSEKAQEYFGLIDER